MEDVYLRDGAYEIREKRFYPDGRTDNGYSVICVPGGGMCAGNHHYLGLELARHGYEVRLLDALFEKSEPTKALGKRRKDVTAEDMNSILDIAIDDASCGRGGNREGRKVVTFGHSMGGFPVLENLGSGVERAITYGTPDFKSFPNVSWIVSAIRVLAPFELEFPMRRMIKMIMEKPTKDYFFNVMPKDPNYDMGNCPAGYPMNYMRSVLDLDVSEKLRRTGTPVSFMYGERDEITKGFVEKAKEIAEENGKVDAVLVPNAYHIRPCERGEPLAEFVDILDRQIMGG